MYKLIKYGEHGYYKQEADKDAKKLRLMAHGLAFIVENESVSDDELAEYVAVMRDILNSYEYDYKVAEEEDNDVQRS